MKKITKATFKSFVKKNRENLLIKTKSSFDGMTDGIERFKDNGFSKAVEAYRVHEEHNLGIQGIWLVNGSRDYFEAYNKDGFVGIEVSNCCGNFVVAIKE